MKMKMKILIVDDARDIRLIVKRIIEKLGYEVDSAVDGEDAWVKLKHTNYQIVISDWMMPNLNGLDLCKRIRSEKFNQYIYFILLADISGKQSLISGIKAGADDFATKPVDSDELEVRLRSARRILDLEHKLSLKNHALIAAHEYIQNDLVNAEETQLKLLPSPLDSEYIKTSWLYKSVVSIGGDTFNYFSPSKDIFVFFSIDVSGHGISSAMLSMSLQSSFALKRGLYGGSISADRLRDIPSIFAGNVNKMLCESKTEHYITMNFGVVDFHNKEIHYVQAGHPNPLFYDHRLNSLKVQKSSGFPIGLIEDASFETQHIKFSPKDKFFIYSDGISEINSALIGDEALEGDNLFQHFDSIKERTGDEIIYEVSNNWLTEEQFKELPDDLSLLIFEFK